MDFIVTFSCIVDFGHTYPMTLRHHLLLGLSLFPAILLSVCVCMSLGIVTEIQEKGCLQARGHLASGYITEENVFPSPSSH